MTPERPHKAPRYGRSDTSSAARWFWEIDKVLVILVAVLIAIGLIAVAAASLTAAVSTPHSVTGTLPASNCANIGPLSPIV